MLFGSDHSSDFNYAAILSSSSRYFLKVHASNNSTFLLTEINNIMTSCAENFTIFELLDTLCKA